MARVDFGLSSTGGGGGGATNLGYVPSPTDGTVTSDTGADATLTPADAVNAGLLLPADFSKLAGLIAALAAKQPLGANLTDIAAITGVQGDVIYHNGTNWVKLAAGTVANVLTTGGAGANPSWASSTISRGHAVASGGTRVGLPGVSMLSTTIQALVTDRMLYDPFMVFTPTTVDAALCEVTTAAGTILRMGIYNADTAWQPTSLVQDAGTVDPSTIGVKTAAFTGIVLPPGRYVQVTVANGACSLRTARGTVEYGELTSVLAGNMFLFSYRKSAVGTGALAGTGVAWDTVVTDTLPHQNASFLRITAV